MTARQWLDGIVVALAVLTGALFSTGSCFFFPGRIFQHGLNLFLAGFGSMIIQESIGMYQTLQQRPSHYNLHLGRSTANQLASTMFALGCIVYALDLRLSGRCFVIGSFGYCVAGLCQVLHSETVLDRAAGAGNLLGSTFFLTASLLYTFTWADADDARQVYRFLAVQFLTGSLLFLAASVLLVTQLCRRMDGQDSTTTPDAKNSAKLKTRFRHRDYQST